MTVDQSDVGKRLKIFRLQQNLNQDKIARLFDRSRSAISAMETGSSNMTLNHLKSLIIEYQINPYWLLFGSEPIISQFAVPTINPSDIEQIKLRLIRLEEKVFTGKPQDDAV